MSEKTLLGIVVALGMLNLYVNYRVAIALSQVKADTDKTISDVKASPLGPVLGFLGLR